MVACQEKGSIYVVADSQSADLPEIVFQAELDAVNCRRRKLNLPVVGIEATSTASMVGRELYGLSLSGGGIRSSTFNLGVLQALDRSGEFHRIDYLSTVSGGGYIGSCLSSYWAQGCKEKKEGDSAQPADDFPFRHISGQPESKWFRHLRQYSNYLKPPCPFAGLRLPGLFLRGLCVNALIVLPFLLFLVIATVLLEKDEIRDALGTRQYDYVIDSDTLQKGRVIQKLAKDDYQEVIINLQPHIEWGHDKNLDILLKTPSVKGIELKSDGEINLNNTITEVINAGWLVKNLSGATNILSITLPVPKKNDKIEVELAAWESDNKFKSYQEGWAYQLRWAIPTLFDAWKLKEPVTLKQPAESDDSQKKTVDYALDINKYIGWKNYIIVGGLPRNSYSEEGKFLGGGRWLFDGRYVNNLKLKMYIPPLDSDLHVSVKAWQTNASASEYAATQSDTKTINYYLENQRVRPTKTDKEGNVQDTLKNPLKIITWSSGEGEEVYDPITYLYHNTFYITRWSVLTMILMLSFYPLLQAGMQYFGLKPWRLRDLMTRYVCGAAVTLVLVVAFLEIQPITIYFFYKMKMAFSTVGIFGGADKAVAMLGSIIAASGGIFTARSMSLGANVKTKVAIYAMGVIGPVVLWVFYLNFCGWVVSCDSVPKMFEKVEGFVICVYLVVGISIYLLSKYFYDVNRTSFHPFYRDRLSQAFLIRPDAETGELQHNDEQNLQGINSGYGPYHILNTTLNIAGKSTADIKGRKADFFSFSREYVGSRVTGYARTADYEAMDNHMGLGTAMAISAAAAAPNMGRETNRCMTFILALFNIRLGYWARNPRLLDPLLTKSYWNRLLSFIWPDKVGPTYLAKEMMGLVNEKSSYINLSDGGHLENMGLYELVRRRCKYIIVCDAEADKSMTCHGFADAIRMVLIDMGIKIRIDLDDIYRKEKKGDGSFNVVGESHYVVGTIQYGKGRGETGYLLYIKSSVCQKHAPYIKDYLARSPDFPHESTADQFFDEAQFEAYRALGWEIGEKVMEELASLPDMTKEQSEAIMNDQKLWKEQAQMQWGNMVKNITSNIS